MKKLAIAGASLALAAMPVVGAFAATSSSFTDTLEVNVKGGCTMQNSLDTTAGTYEHADRSFSAEVNPGNVVYLNASNATTALETQGTITVSCNSTDSTKTYTVTVDVTGLEDNASHTISGGVATSGATSAWAIKSNASGTTASNPFQNYAAAADGTFLTAAATNSVTFNPSYQVYVGPNQAPGVYGGTAVYTVSLPQN